MNKIDLNCDLGESFGAYKIGKDEEVIPLITSANIACGFHASDPVVMEHTFAMADRYGVHAGAHPGFPDLAGFGRRSMKLSPEEVRDMIIYQIGAAQAFSRAHGMLLQHVKPHGALYNMAAKDHELARAICEGICMADPELILLGLSDSEHGKAAKETGLRFASEVFADRAYEADGSLVARSKPGAVITDENRAVARTVRMIKEGRVTAADGTEILLHADSVCVHGDNEKALLFVQKLREAFEKEKICLVPLCEIV